MDGYCGPVARTRKRTRCSVALFLSADDARSDAVSTRACAAVTSCFFFFFQAEDGIRDLTLEFRRVLFRSLTVAPTAALLEIEAFPTPRWDPLAPVRHPEQTAETPPQSLGLLTSQASVELCDDALVVREDRKSVV